MKWMQFLVRKLYPYGKQRVVLRGPVRGVRFVVVPGMAATYALGVDNMHWHFLKEKVGEGDVVYDVGANCGQMALFFSRRVGSDGGVYSFEPVSQNAAILRLNLNLNHCCNVEVIEAALASSSEPRRFCFDAAHHTMGTLEGAMVKLDRWQTTLDVPCITLDAVLAQGARPPDVIKIDVEGAGLGVIEGGSQLIGEYRPGIYFELHAATKDALELQALKMLRDRWGYGIQDLNGNLEADRGPMWNGAVWCEPPSQR
jgi:FkbM family methyltransferase